MSDEEDEALCYDEPADQLVTPNHRGDNDDACGEEFLYLGAMMFSFREVRHILRRALALLTSASLLHNNSSDRDIAALSVEELQKMVMTVLGRDDGHMPHDAEPQRDATKEEQEAEDETGDLDREKTDSALHGLLATLHGFLEQYRVVPRKGRVAGMHDDARSEVPIEASIREGPNNSAAVVTAASIPSGRGRQPSSTSLNATTTAAVVESDEKPTPSVAVPSGPSGAPPPPARAGSARTAIANAVAAARDIATTRRPNSAAAAVAAAAVSLPPPCLPPFRSSSATSFRPTTSNGSHLPPGATNESNPPLAHHNGALPLSSPTPPAGPGGPPGSVSVGSLVFPDYSRDAATTFQTIHKTLHHDDGKSIFAPLAYTESQFGGGGGVVAAGGGGAAGSAASPDAAIDIMADHTVTDKRRPTCVPLRNQNATSSHRDSDPLHALEPKRRHFVQQFFNDPKKIENRRQMMLAEELNKLAQTAQAAALLQYRPSSQNRHGAHSAHLQSQLNANTTTGAAAADLSFDGSVAAAPNHNLRLPSNWAGAASPVFVPMHRPASAPLVAAASSHKTAPPSSSHPSMPLPTIDVEEVNSSRVAARADDATAAAGDEPPHHLSITMDPAHRHPHHHQSQEEVVQSTRSVDVPFSQHVKSLRERRGNAAAAVGNNSAAADVTTTAAAATGRPGSSSSATPPTVLAASHIYADKGLHQRHIAVSQDHVLSSSSSPSYAEVGLHSSSSLGHHSTTGHSRPGTALQHVWHTTMPSQRLPSPTIQSTSYTMPSSSLLLVSQHTSPLRQQQQHAGTAMSQVAAPSALSPTPLATTPGTTAAVPSTTTTTTTASAIGKTTSVVERATARKVLSASHRVPSRVPLGGMGSSKPLL